MKRWYAITLFLFLSACGSPPTPVLTGEDIQNTAVAEAVKGIFNNLDQTAAAIPTLTNTLTTFPTDTSTLEPSFTTVPTLTTVPTDTPLPLPTDTLVVVVPTSAPAAGVCSCTGDIYNCNDFSSHASAQACFNYCVSLGRGDIHNLDRDGDGDACESL